MSCLLLCTRFYDFDGDFKGWTRFVQSLFFPYMKERDKRGSNRVNAEISLT